MWGSNEFEERKKEYFPSKETKLAAAGIQSKAVFQAVHHTTSISIRSSCRTLTFPRSAYINTKATTLCWQEDSKCMYVWVRLNKNKNLAAGFDKKQIWNPLHHKIFLFDKYNISNLIITQCSLQNSCDA